MTNKERIEDLLIEFDELDMQPMLIVPNPTDRAKAWKDELIYAIEHLEADLAREIFAKIERIIGDSRVGEYSKEFGFSVRSYYNGAMIVRGLDELKKTYTEGDNG